ncbi:MAG: galactokinase family protein, partial [Bacteroidota bacterium]|nr:galactokinase family protein [Bacteroidota bacterium]
MAKINSLTAKIADGKNSLFQELYGFDDSVLKEQASRYSGLMAEFQKSYGTDDVELFSSPGRTEIGGNHTDHNYGRVLAGAVNLDMIAV